MNKLELDDGDYIEVDGSIMFHGTQFGYPDQPVETRLFEGNPGESDSDTVRRFAGKLLEFADKIGGKQ